MNAELSALPSGGVTRRTVTSLGTVDAALWLTRRGIPVFPCGNNKAPLTKHGHKDATADEAQVRRWWTRYPDALVGVPTGSISRLVVIDVDPAGIDFILGEHGDLLGTGRQHNTRRGFHYLFRLPAGVSIRNSAGKIAEGVDVRAEGGYIVWWPAVGRKSFGPELEELPVLPDALLKLVVEEARRDVKSVLTPEFALYHTISEGQRNAFLASEAGKLRRINSDPVVISEAMHALNQRRCSPPVESKEVDQIVQSILRYPPHDSIPSASARDFTVIHDSQFIERDPATWHIKGVVPKAELIVVYGQSGTGKSFLVFDMAAAIATGTPWQDRKTTKSRVLFVLAEGAAGFRNRLLAYTKAHAGSFPGVHIVTSALNLLNEQDHILLAQGIEVGGGADLIIIDTLAAASPGADENAAKDMGVVIDHCKQLNKATGATVLLVHHSGKDQSKGARGWSGLRAAADAEIEVTRNGEDRIATVTKMKDGEDGAKFAFKLVPVEVGVDADDEPISSCIVEPATVVPSGNRKEPQPGTKERTLLDAIRNALASDGRVTTASVIETVVKQLPKPDGRDLRKQHFTRALQALATKGLITIEGDTCRAL